MPDFGPKWKWVRNLGEGGQAHTFIVQQSDGESPVPYVAKRLKNPKRSDRFKREIKAVRSLNHPRVLSIVDEDVDSSGRPFLVTEFCSKGSLKDYALRGEWSDLKKFEIFYQVCEAVAYAHSRSILHRDIKPKNIFLRDDETAVLGDFGICYVEDDGKITLTEEVMGSRYYCAPELRDGRTDRDTPPELADIYSLGKVLYWLFTDRVFDGHEEKYGNPAQSIAQTFRDLDYYVPPYERIFAGSLVDEIVAETVVRDPNERSIRSTGQLVAKVAITIDRLRAGGRPLYLELSKRCLFCASGEYRPAHLLRLGNRPGGKDVFPNVQKRRGTTASTGENIYVNLTEIAADNFGSPHKGAPLVLICNRCGNVQQFRLDLTEDGHGEKWRP